MTVTVEEKSFCKIKIIPNVSLITNLQRHQGCQGEELVCQHQKHHLGGNQHHHPEQEKLLPGELSVEPFGKDLDVPGDNLPQFRLNFLGKSLLNNRDLERV